MGTLLRSLRLPAHPGLYSHLLTCKKRQVSFRAKRGIFYGADHKGAAEDFSRWSKWQDC